MQNFFIPVRQRLIFGTALGLVFLLSVMIPTRALAAKVTATFREGVSPNRDYDVQDAELRASSPDWNFEPNPRWNVGTDSSGAISREAVIFPISLPPGALVTSVRLDVWQQSAPTGSYGAQRKVDLHVITNPVFTSESAVAWNIIGMGILWKHPGGDYDPTVLSSITPSNLTTSTQFTFPSSVPFLAAVKSALAGDHRLRLLVRAHDEKTVGIMSFYASDGHTMGDAVKPLLTIEYELSGPQPVRRDQTAQPSRRNAP